MKVTAAFLCTVALLLSQTTPLDYVITQGPVLFDAEWNDVRKEAFKRVSRTNQSLKLKYLLPEMEEVHTELIPRTSARLFQVQLDLLNSKNIQEESELTLEGDVLQLKVKDTSPRNESYIVMRYRDNFWYEDHFILNYLAVKEVGQAVFVAPNIDPQTKKQLDKCLAIFDCDLKEDSPQEYLPLLLNNCDDITPSALIQRVDKDTILLQAIDNYGRVTSKAHSIPESGQAIRHFWRGVWKIPRFPLISIDPITAVARLMVHPNQLVTCFFLRWNNSEFVYKCSPTELERSFNYSLRPNTLILAVQFGDYPRLPNLYELGESVRTLTVDHTSQPLGLLVKMMESLVGDFAEIFAVRVD